MLISTAIAVLLITWCSVFLLDYGLRLKECAPYLRLANRLGLEVSPFQIRFYFNWVDSKTIALTSEKKSDVKRNSARSTIIDLWFNFGAIVSIVCLFGITIYLTRSVYNDVNEWLPSLRAKHPSSTFRGEYRSMKEMLLTTTTMTPMEPQPATPEQAQEVHQLLTDEDYDVLQTGQKEQGGLVPIIPGFNLPISHMPIFILVLIVAAVFHELGHAWAAVRSDVRVNGFGFFLIGIYPGAFTDIENYSLKRTSLRQQLTIFGAGIWHNLVLAAMAYLMFTSSPILLSPLFTSGQGVTVRGVDVRSALHGSNGLVSGDVIRRVDDCHVTSPADWLTCLRTVANQRTGKCIDKKLVEQTTTSVVWISNDEVHCCDEFNASSIHVCFEREEQVLVTRQLATKAPNLNSVLGMEDRKAEVVTEKYAKATKYSCLNAKKVAEQDSCNVTVQCAKQDSDLCVYPALFNGTQLVRIGIDRAPVLFVGHVREMMDLVEVDGLTARFSWVSHDWLEAFELVAKYLFTLSLALALLNALPCYALDGQFIVGVLLKSTGLGTRKRNMVKSLILTIGTLLLVMSIIVGFIRLVIS